MAALPVELSASIPNDVRTLCSRLAEAGCRSWIVGGCTRDLLLGRAAHDWDIATDARPEQVMHLFKRVIPTGIQHGTVTVIVGSASYEVTTLRGEGAYSDGRHPDRVAFVTDLHEDLARRDFTVNAIAFDPLACTLHDPFAGIADLDARLLRAVGKPEERFNEDGLRVLRAARFAATLGFAVEPATLAAIPSALETLRKVSMERVRDELFKTLVAPKPSVGLQLMLDTGILGVVLADLVPMAGCTQNKYHAHDVWMHTMHCVDACANDLVLRLAALLHDVGKPAVRALGEKTNDWTFYEHEQHGARMADTICAVLKTSNEQRARVVHLVRQHLVLFDHDWSDSAVRRWVQRAGAAQVADVLALARADAGGKGTDPGPMFERIEALRLRVDALAAEGMALTVRDLVVGGRDLIVELGVTPGPMIGRTLDHLLELVIDEPEANERSRLIVEAKAYVASNSAAGSAPE